ncbi:enoyl-CoA hydratase domain-containing protein 3, mitochondrial-like isoform X1 [Acropora millepora]|uniref:enoyl-CoA hydratase domain-containing protein 3, mitochondrial-like isoform X1 n=2 Tax=Acropora millepora TaxID=45264 RepID=UPI001CF183CF|nr:enoyl-CoA hydratase domain-containing protein 3, mitochondrial-like isoform X1 [Acropora millepora]
MLPNFCTRLSCKKVIKSCVRSLTKGAGDLTVCSQENGIRKIVLNNPGRRNALSLAMLDTLKSNLLHNVDSNLRVIILSANGGVFSSGHDLKELTKDQGKDYHEKVFHRCTEVMTLVQDIPVPVIAQVNGLATAAGCQLVASCDIAVASTKSQFATPGVNIGLFCSTPGVALARAVPRKIALEMLFTGNPITAEEALKHGLLSKAVPEEKLEEEVNLIAEKIVSLSQPVVAMGKSCFYSQVTKTRDQAYNEAESTMVENLELYDGQEGINAFIQKRKPTWKNISDCH